MTPEEMLRWLSQGPMVQEGQRWVHENQAFWDLNPALPTADGTTVQFRDWVLQGATVTDGTSWMTENQFLWNHRNDADQSPWLRMDDGTMVHFDQWLQQGPIVQGGVTENQFLWNHQGEQWIFQPDPNDSSTGTMVTLDDWLQQGPTVTAPDGTKTNLNRFLYDHRDDNGADPWEMTPTGQMMRRSQFVQWGPPTTGPDGQKMTQGQFILDHPDDPHNPWIYLPFAPGDPYAAYLDPQYLQSNGVDVQVNAPRTATTLSDYSSKTAVNVRSMVGLAKDLTYQHRPSVAEVLRQLNADMQGVEDALGLNTAGLRPGPMLTTINSMRSAWPPAWQSFVGNGNVTDAKNGGLFALVHENIGAISERSFMGAHAAYKGELAILDGIKAAGYDIGAITMPEDPQVLMDDGRTGPG